MISHFRHLRTYFHQIFNNRRQLTSLTSIFPVQSNANYELTRKFPSVYDTDHSKEKLLNVSNRRHFTFQSFTLRSYSSSSESNGPGQSELNARTLMVAGLSKDTTVVALRACFSKKWDVTDCRIARHKQTGVSRQFGFVEFETVEQAKHALEFDHYIDRKQVTVKICGNKELDEKYRIFVGGLLKETSGETLERHFSQFGDLFDCNIVRKENNVSRGFGYVTYKSQDSVDHALNSQLHCIDGKEVYVKHATPRRRELTLFIENLSPKTTDESLKEHFSKYGQLTQCNVKIDRKTGQSRGFGYVAFELQEDLDSALNDQHVIDGVEVKPIDKQTSDLDLIVECLPQNISEESLKNSLWDYFSRYGRVRQCTIIKNSVGNTTAFVAMSSKDEISRALAGRPHWIDTIDKLVDTHKKGEHFTVYVGGIHPNTTNEDLYEKFSKVGNPVHWDVKCDPNTNRPLGYGFVSFSSPEEVDRVMDGRPYYINGRELTVERRLGRKKQ